MPIKVLLIVPEAAADSVAAALRRELDATVDAAPNTRTAIAALRRDTFDLVLLDEAFAAADPEAEKLYLTAAPLLEINFALSGAPRIVRQVRAALTRRARDLELAQVTATGQLCSELNHTLAGLLLESELALQQASPAQVARLQMVVQLAGGLRSQLMNKGR
jgi:hypothetical protein